MYGGQPAAQIPGLDLTGAQKLIRIVREAGYDFMKEHADGAEAPVVCGIQAQRR
jgi:hypothetical protein